MIIDIEITNVMCKILTPIDTDISQTLSYNYSFKVEGSEYKVSMYARRHIYWDGRKKMYNMQTRQFPVGLLSAISSMLTNMGHQINYINHRKGNNIEHQYHVTNFDERDYQMDVVIKSVVNGNGIVKVATGGGKTTIAARTIAAIGRVSIFVVHTRDLLYQTIKSFTRMFPNETIGQIGDGVYDYQNITVATMQTLAILSQIKYEAYSYDEDNSDTESLCDPTEEMKQQFESYSDTVGVVMFDEVQRICSQTAYTARFLFKNANYAFGYSASPWRDDGSDLMIEAAFGSRICDVSASYLIDRGYLVQPIITIKDVNSSYIGRSYAEIYKSAIVESVERNIQVIKDACEQYNLGRNTLILINHIKHGEILESMLHDKGIDAVFISGKSNMKKRKQVIQDMCDGNIQLVIASTIADVGLDVPRLQSIIEAGAGKSSVTALQRLGRIMRPFAGKDHCYFITYRDNVPYINKHINQKIAIWQTERDFIIIDQHAI